MCLRYLKSQLSEFFMSAIFFLFLNQKMDCIKISFFFFLIFIQSLMLTWSVFWKSYSLELGLLRLACHKCPMTEYLPSIKIGNNYGCSIWLGMESLQSVGIRNLNSLGLSGPLVSNRCPPTWLARQI